MKAQGIAGEYLQQQNKKTDNKLALLRMWLDSDWTPYAGSDTDICDFDNVLFRSANGGYGSLTLSLPNSDGTIDILTSNTYSQSCSYNIKTGRNKTCFFVCTTYDNTIVREGNLLVLYSKNLENGKISRSVVGKKREEWVKRSPLYHAIKRCYDTQNLSRCVPLELLNTPANQS